MASDAFLSILSSALKAPSVIASSAGRNSSRSFMSNPFMSSPGRFARWPVIPGDRRQQEPHEGLRGPAPRPLALQPGKGRAGRPRQHAEKARRGEEARVFVPDGGLAIGGKGKYDDDHHQDQGD